MKEIHKKSKKIALIGHMGSGKSLIGKLIAKNLNLKHFDSDNLIEKQFNTSITEIFQLHGEPFGSRAVNDAPCPFETEVRGVDVSGFMVQTHGHRAGLLLGKHVA